MPFGGVYETLYAFEKKKKNLHRLDEHDFNPYIAMEVQNKSLRTW
jgi:hypothetical protein